MGDAHGRHSRAPSPASRRRREPTLNPRAVIPESSFFKDTADPFEDSVRSNENFDYTLIFEWRRRLHLRCFTFLRNLYSSSFTFHG